MKKAHVRVARPSDNLKAVTHFYHEGLGFEVLGHFHDHEGFHGVMLGHTEAGYHLEFTQQDGHATGGAPSKDHLLVFYLPEKEDWSAAVQHMKSSGYPAVAAWNPYWAQNGVTFEDPDGYRIVLQNTAWLSHP